MNSVINAKKLLRADMKKCLSLISSDSRASQSEIIYKKLIKMPCYQNSKKVGVYLNMKEEVKTDKIIEDIFASGKECFIPWYNKNVMKMIKLYSLEDLNSLPLNKWNIKQPIDPESRDDSFLEGGLDLILVPGLALSLTGQRLGRGKGYYDKFLRSMAAHCTNNKTALTCVALGFTDQILKEVPTESHDYTIDIVLHPN